jgi:hypothetical protein
MKALKEETDYKMSTMVNVYDTRIRDLETRFSGHLKDGKIKFR